MLLLLLLYISIFFYEILYNIRDSEFYKCLIAIIVTRLLRAKNRDNYRHVKSHESIHFPCDKCRKMYSYKAHLTRHDKTDHISKMVSAVTKVPVKPSAGLYIFNDDLEDLEQYENNKGKKSHL